MGDAALTEAYNAAVDALRRFRDAHLRIVALYIIGPSHHSAHTSATAPTLGGQVTSIAITAADDDNVAAAEVCTGQKSTGIGTGEVAPPAPGLLHGTGGTDLVRFLKGVRDRTFEATLPVNSGTP